MSAILRSQATLRRSKERNLVHIPPNPLRFYAVELFVQLANGGAR
jgi:hypothetical protein